VGWNPLHLHCPSVVDRIQRKARRVEPSTRRSSIEKHDRNDHADDDEVQCHAEHLHQVGGGALPLASSITVVGIPTGPITGRTRNSSAIAPSRASEAAEQSEGRNDPSDLWGQAGPNLRGHASVFLLPHLVGKLPYSPVNFGLLFDGASHHLRQVRTPGPALERYPECFRGQSAVISSDHSSAR
jgi:hypothetical protein